ncbi:hypothetical protein ACFV0T_35370 [Streptomyces sp. NPDC059582]|uniref:hypothetical protein n=1 Tax=Streptomyces sp. NPDC059582 TaxID=3346875 RepID=UPI00369BEDB7
MFTVPDYLIAPGTARQAPSPGLMGVGHVARAGRPAAATRRVSASMMTWHVRREPVVRDEAPTFRSWTGIRVPSTIHIRSVSASRRGAASSAGSGRSHWGQAFSNSLWAAGTPLLADADKVALLLETTPTGVFAAGDVRSRSAKGVASAAPGAGRREALGRNAA